MIWTSLEEIFRCLIATRGEPDVDALVRTAVQEQGRLHGFKNVTDYLRWSHLEGLYNRALSPPLDVSRLALLTRKLELPLEIDSRPAPWNQWKKGMSLVVVVGKRPVELFGSQSLKHFAVGARDTEALTRIVDFVQKELALSCRIEVLALRSDLPDEEARAELERLLRRDDVGGIVALGSRIVNPILEPLCRQMLEEGRSFPAHFRWSAERHPGGALSDPDPCAPGEEGIRLSGHETTTYPRDSDAGIWKQVEQAKPRVHGEFGDNAATVDLKDCITQTVRSKTFKDCGMLVVDARKGKPTLIACAGHGGCGTLAAVYALEDLERVATGLEKSHNPETALIGSDRIFEIVEVRRRKPSADPVDDLDFARNKDGWNFWEL